MAKISKEIRKRTTASKEQRKDTNNTVERCLEKQRKREIERAREIEKLTDREVQKAYPNANKERKRERERRERERERERLERERERERKRERERQRERLERERERKRERERDKKESTRNPLASQTKQAKKQTSYQCSNTYKKRRRKTTLETEIERERNAPQQRMRNRYREKESVQKDKETECHCVFKAPLITVFGAWSKGVEIRLSLQMKLSMSKSFIFRLFYLQNRFRPRDC